MSRFETGTFGEVAWNTEFAGYRFSKTRHARGLRLPKHSHDLASINFVLEGAYIESCTATCGEFEKYDFLLKPPGETHSNHFGNHHARCLLIEFETTRFASLCESLPWMNRNVHARNPEIRSCGIRLLTELNSTIASSRIAAESAVLDLLLAVESDRRKSELTIPLWIQQVEEYLRENRHLKFSLDEIANRFDVYASHLSREFRRHYSRTIGDYLRSLRIEDASRMLRETNIPVSQIAEECGFADQSHLGRWFKHFTGTTPGKFRQRLR